MENIVTGEESENNVSNLFSSPLGPRVYDILLIQYYNVICRPSEYTGEAPGRDSNPGLLEAYSYIGKLNYKC